MSVWYYADASNDRQGPVTPAELVRLRLQGTLGWGSLVWRDGMGDWQPMRDFAGELAQADDRGPLLSTADGRVHPATADGPASVAPAEPLSPYAPPTAAIAQEAAIVHGHEVVYAGFWKRFAALVIDSMLVTAVYYAVFFVLLMMFGLGSMGALSAAGGAGGAEAFGTGMAMAMVLAYLCYPVISGLYYVLMESSSHQATLGKLAVGIKVTGIQGARIGRGNALGRWVSHLLCYFTVYIGYLMAAFTERKQGLHDMVASTLVVDRWAFTDRPELQRRELGVVTWVILAIAGGLIGLSLLAIVAAIAIPALSR
ncbi:MAG: RDD family protein [Proteobacteria bacterium]|nr:RDD family protein [Pseudomonadota bacterium]